MAQFVSGGLVDLNRGTWFEQDAFPRVHSAVAVGLTLDHRISRTLPVNLAWTSSTPK